MLRPFVAVLALLAVSLAGCSGGGGGEGAGDGIEDVPELDATDTTGVIRAVVVDEAIRPIADTLVVVQGGSASVNKTTGADGFAGFEDLEPGSYVVQAAKPGYTSLPQTVQVEADVDDPPVVKLLLTAIQGDRPFYQEIAFEGYMQCAAGTPVVSGNFCFIANYYPCFAQQTAGQQCSGNLTSDNSFFEVGFIRDNGRVPDWVQVEMVWESSQAVSEELALRADIQGPDDLDIPYDNDTAGPSPIYVTFNRTEGDEWGLGVNRSLYLEVFTSQENTPVGVAANQLIKYFVHAFYGYTPPPGWRFSDGSGVPMPPY